MPIAGYTQNIDALVMLQSRAVTYYNDGDYSNSIILYEDLLAEQEIIYGKEDIRVAETLNRLGELYLYTDLSDVSDYYFNEAIIIFQNALQAGKNALEMPLMNLLKIYTFKNDSIMMRNIEQRLHSISTIFQSPSSIYPEFQFDADTLYSPEEDLASERTPGPGTGRCQCHGHRRARGGCEAWSGNGGIGIPLTYAFLLNKQERPVERQV